jgi:cytochrome oxidase Cu insertion factor (SCO1/SenC/PrrC family)
MKRRSLATIFALWLVAGAMLCPVSRAQSNKKEPEAMKLKVGDMAPDFKLEYVDGKEEKEVSLSQYRGKSNVVVAFYVFAFTGG